MRTPKEILEQYGKCCVSEHLLTHDRLYSAEEADTHRKKDDFKLESIRGQKISLEWMFE